MNGAPPLYQNKFNGHMAYLSPDWDQMGVVEDASVDNDNENIGLSHDLHSLVTNELNSYITNHVQFYREALSESGHSEEDGDVLLELDETLNDIVHQHADANFTYCKQLLHYLTKAHIEDGNHLELSKLNTVLEEYFEYAPGPWREVALIDVLTRSIIPNIMNSVETYQIKTQTHTDDDVVDPSFSHEVNDDDMNGSIISSSDGIGGGFTGSSGDIDDSSETGSNSLLSLPYMTRNEQHKLGIKLKKAMNTINRYKAETAMLKETLENAKSNNVTMLQDKYRGAQSDLTFVRRRNNELKDRVQILESSYFKHCKRVVIMKARLKRRRVMILVLL